MLKVDTKELRSLSKNIGKYEKKILTQIDILGKSSANNLEKEAKKNARWIDRTGQARRSIKGEYNRDNQAAKITLSGYAKKRAGTRRGKWGEDYFQHLEFHKNEKYSILRPTMEKNIKRISLNLSERISKIRINGD